MNLQYCETTTSAKFNFININDAINDTPEMFLGKENDIKVCINIQFSPTQTSHT